MFHWEFKLWGPTHTRLLLPFALVVTSAYEQIEWDRTLAPSGHVTV